MTSRRGWAVVASHLMNISLHWNARGVTTLMADNNIHCREALSRVLHQPRANVYRSFGGDWSGTPTIELLAVMSSVFDVPISHLIEHEKERSCCCGLSERSGGRTCQMSFGRR